MFLQAGTRGNPNGDILVVAESWGAEEARLGQPLVGASGKELDKMMLEAGIDPERCYFTNVINERPAGNQMTQFFIPTKEARANKLPCIRGLYPSIKILNGIDKLEELINKFNPKLIIGLGNYSLWALTETDFHIGDGKGDALGYKIPTGIQSYRGSQLRSRFGNIPFLPTVHPAALFRNWSLRWSVVHDLRARVGKAAAASTWDEPNRNYIISPSFDKCMATLTDLQLRASLSSTPILLSVDVETISPWLECFAIAWSNLDAICIPLMCKHIKEGYWTALEEQMVMNETKKLLEHPNVEIVGQNFLYDYYYFAMHGIRPRWRHDTMLALHTCFPGSPLDLNYISSLFCEFHSYWKDDGKEAIKKHDDLQRWTYNCRDVVVTYEAINEIWKVLEYYNLEQHYAFQMVRAISAVEGSCKGFLTDKRKRSEEAIVHVDVLDRYEWQLENVMPESVWVTPKGQKPWYGSPQQLGKIIYDELGVAEVIDRGTKKRTMDDEALRIIGNREPILKPLCRKIQEFRSYRSSGQFIYMKVGSDNRVRCTMSPTAETYRYRSSEAPDGTGRNLQNIPSGNEEK